MWFAAIGHQGYTGKHGSPVDVARFVRMIVAATFGAIGHYRGLGLVLGALLVVGLVLAWRPLPAAERRSRAAAPLGLLIGAFSLLCITGYGRAGLASFDEKSRYLHLVAAMLLPALAIAADAVMRRWRVVAPVVVVVLVIGIPGNVNVIVDYMHRPFVRNQVVYRRMMLSLPQVAAAKEAPRGLTPDRELAHFVTIGWLLDGVPLGSDSQARAHLTGRRGNGHDPFVVRAVPQGRYRPGTSASVPRLRCCSVCRPARRSSSARPRAPSR